MKGLLQQSLERNAYFTFCSRFQSRIHSINTFPQTTHTETHEAALSVTASDFWEVGQTLEATVLVQSENEGIWFGDQETGAQETREHGTLLKHVSLQQEEEGERGWQGKI